MREFDYKSKYSDLLTPELVSLLNKIYECKGAQSHLISLHQDVLSSLLEVAKIQSTESSNRIEGINTTHDRIRSLVNNKTTPKTRDELEIAGYRDVLSIIHDSYEYIPVNCNIILQLHRDLYRYELNGFGGKFKNTDNSIEETDEQGNKFIRFIPLSAFETPGAVDNLCKELDENLKSNCAEPLILISMFILDFLCIHPFNDGNGRMSRLLTLLLLYRNGFDVGKYISIEKIIEKTKDSYYESLKLSSDNWHDGKNDYEPFVKYMLTVMLLAYREFEQRSNILADNSLSKIQIVRNAVRDNLGTITKTQIMELCPNISQITVQRALNNLLKTNEIRKIGSGRYTKYVFNYE